jgi:hypothetical protein
VGDFPDIAPPAKAILGKTVTVKVSAKGAVQLLQSSKRARKEKGGK